MFRTRKSEDPFNDRRPADKPAEKRSLLDISDGSVASSALRWLTGSDEQAGAPGDAAKTAESDHDVEDDASDILDLTDPLDPTQAKEEGPGGLSKALLAKDAARGPTSLPASDLAPTSENFPASDDLNDTAADDTAKARADIMQSLEIDDLDDLDDLDEIPLWHLIHKSGFDDDEQAGDAGPVADQGPLALPLPDKAAMRDRQEDVTEQTPRSTVENEAAKPDQGSEDPALSKPAPPSPEPPAPEVPSPAPAAPSNALPPDDGQADLPPAASLEVTSEMPQDTSLALRPIPELQAGSRAAAKARRASAADAGGAKDASEPPSAPAPAPLPEQADDDIEALTEEPADPDADRLNIEALELDLESSDESDDSVDDDWHAHLADVLGKNDDTPLAPTEKTTSRERPVKAVGSSQTPAFRDQGAPAAPVVPLTRTLHDIATADKPDREKSEIPPFSLLARAARQKTAALGQSKPALPADASELSLVQVSLGIVANVPRLRRFAAAQIGDELMADRLVQMAAETALADPCSLQPASDLGLALIKLLYRHRESMLADPSAIDRSPEDSHTFETELCQGLAGADQFEMHQFATAINGLDERDREFLIMVNLENLTYGQIADIVQMQKARVMAMVSNARMRLRQALAIDEAGSRDKSPTTIFTPHHQEIDIHGYLDGELDSDHMAEIDALVEHDEDAADRLVHYGIQGDLIRRLYAPLINRPIPGNLLESLSTAAKPARRGFRLGARRALIAGAIIITLGFGAIGSGIAVALSGFFSDPTTTVSSVKSTP